MARKRRTRNRRNGGRDLISAAAEAAAATVALSLSIHAFLKERYRESNGGVDRAS